MAGVEVSNRLQMRTAAQVGQLKSWVSTPFAGAWASTIGDIDLVPQPRLRRGSIAALVATRLAAAGSSPSAQFQKGACALLGLGTIWRKAPPWLDTCDVQDSNACPSPQKPWMLAQHIVAEVSSGLGHASAVSELIRRGGRNSLRALRARNSTMSCIMLRLRFLPRAAPPSARNPLRLDQRNCPTQAPRPDRG